MACWTTVHLAQDFLSYVLASPYTWGLSTTVSFLAFDFPSCMILNILFVLIYMSLLKKYKNLCRLYKFLIYVFIAYVFCNSHILYAAWSLAYLYLNSYNWVCLWKNCPRIWNNLNFSFFIQRFIYCKTIGYFCCHATLLVLLVKSVSWNLCSSCNL